MRLAALFTVIDMKIHFTALALSVLLSACSSSTDTPSSATGGQSGTTGKAGSSSGGTSGSNSGGMSGGGTSSGGMSSTGGSVSSGGTTASGGMSTVGGMSSGGNAGAGGNSGGSAGGATCPSKVVADSHAAQRSACSYVSGDLPAKTLDLTEAERAQIPIKHIVVIMKENRSFDHILGALKKTQPDADVYDSTFVNKDGAGKSVTPFHQTTTCVGFDPDHQWDAMHAQINGGKMDGYVTSAAKSTATDGHFSMSYYDEKDLPFYYFLANTFAVADRYFPSVRSGTFPNRDYLLFGTSDKVYSTQYSTWPSPSLPMIFDELTKAKVSWGVYADDHPFSEAAENPADDWEQNNPWSPIADLIDAFKNDKVPSVVFVDGLVNIDDEHPTADVQHGEAWTKKLYDAARTSPAWQSTVLFYTYDEAGGFADHVPPPNDTCLARAADSDFHELGTRVPFIAVSPWARRHYVSHVEKQHTSVTRFIEAVFGLPALTARDANSDALLDMFDFSCAPAAVPDAPAAGSGGCGAGAKLWLDKVTFAPNEDIVVHFSGGPGNPTDWIGVYPRTSAVQPGSTIWGYVGGGGHTASVGNTSGTITLGAGSGAWPLAAGTSWSIYYLVADGYTSIAGTEFDITN